MAKIAMIVKSLSPEVLSLAQVLLSRKDELTLITGREVFIPEYVPCQVITPFKDWSFSEAVQLFARWANQWPDVIHFVFSQPLESPTRADWLLTRLIQPFPRKAIVATFFYSPNELRGLWSRKFLTACHGMSWGSSIHLLQAKRAGLLTEGIITEVIPPFWIPQNLKEHPVSQDLPKLLEKIQPYLYVPGASREFLENARTSELFFDVGLQFAFTGRRPQRDRHLTTSFFVEPQNEAELYLTMKKSKAVLLAFNSLTLSDLQKFWVWSQELQVPLLVSPEQNQIFPGLVHHGKTGWILDNGEETLRTIVRDEFRLSRPKSDPSTYHFPLFDSASNQLARLFAQALSLRS